MITILLCGIIGFGLGYLNFGNDPKYNIIENRITKAATWMFFGFLIGLICAGLINGVLGVTNNFGIDVKK